MFCVTAKTNEHFGYSDFVTTRRYCTHSSSSPGDSAGVAPTTAVHATGTTVCLATCFSERGLIVRRATLCQAATGRLLSRQRSAPSPAALAPLGARRCSCMEARGLDLSTVHRIRRVRIPRSPASATPLVAATVSLASASERRERVLCVER